VRKRPTGQPRPKLVRRPLHAFDGGRARAPQGHRAADRVYQELAALLAGQVAVWTREHDPAQKVTAAATSPGVGHCQGDGVGDVLGISVRQAPTSLCFIQQYSLSPVEHAFEIAKHAVAWIVRSMDGGQAQDGAGNGMVQDHALN
jgi:hypothetical protein